jgi:uncharacterized membrane protein
MPRLITIGLAVYSFFLIQTSLPSLPARIPTHFNAAGEADGWGSPDSLWVLLLIQVLVGGLFLVIPLLGRRFPESVNIGSLKLSDYTPAQRERIMPLLTDMMGYISVLFSLLFCLLLRQAIRAASSPHPHLAVWWVFGVMVAGTALTLIYYIRRIDDVAKETRR